MLKELKINSSKREEVIDITEEVKGIVRDSGVDAGICLVYVGHTTAAVITNENDDPKVCDDILTLLKTTVPRGKWEHDVSGRCDRESNADAHIKATIIGPSESLVISKGEIVLGQWQNLMLCDFDGPRSRKVMVKIIKG